jgi:hypothetical protein
MSLETQTRTLHIHPNPKGGRASYTRKEVAMPVYKFQCHRCFTKSGIMSSNPQDAPSCCDGELMVPILVDSTKERDHKEEYTQHQLDYLVSLINYMSQIISEYEAGTRDRRFTPADNQARLRELITERDGIYHDELCEAARQLGYEYLPLPASPHWQAPDGRMLYLTYQPSPKQ